MRYKRAICRRRELDHIHALRAFATTPPPQSHPSLADTTGTCQREKPSPAQQSGDVCQFFFSAASSASHANRRSHQERRRKYDQNARCNPREHIEHASVGVLAHYASIVRQPLHEDQNDRQEHSVERLRPKNHVNKWKPG